MYFCYWSNFWPCRIFFHKVHFLLSINQGKTLGINLVGGKKVYQDLLVCWVDKNSLLGLVAYLIQYVSLLLSESLSYDWSGFFLFHSFHSRGREEEHLRAKERSLHSSASISSFSHESYCKKNPHILSPLLHDCILSENIHHLAWVCFQQVYILKGRLKGFSALIFFSAVQFDKIQLHFSQNAFKIR